MYKNVTLVKNGSPELDFRRQNWEAGAFLRRQYSLRPFSSQTFLLKIITISMRLNYCCLRPMAKVPSNFLSCSSGHFVNLLLGWTNGVHFWFKSGCRPKTSPGLVILNFIILVISIVCHFVWSFGTKDGARQSTLPNKASSNNFFVFLLPCNIYDILIFDTPNKEWAVWGDHLFISVHWMQVISLIASHDKKL